MPRIAAALALASSITVGVLVTSPVSASSADSSGVRLEFGFSADVTNEQFFEESYTDTTFRSRDLRELPETRRAGVAALSWLHRAKSGAWTMRWRPELSLGDKARRALAAGRVDWGHIEEAAWSVEPRLEWREDESFGLERSEWRADLRTRYRRAWSAADRLEVAAGGEWLDATGEDVSLLLDRRVVRTSARWTHLPVFGWEWGLRLAADGRVFPDSTSRDHSETGLSLEAGRLFGEAHRFSSVFEIQRRSAIRSVSSTRDRFWAPRVSIGLDLRSTSAARLHWAAEAEAIRYDVPEEASYFDYELVRTRLELGRDIGGGWAARLGPRLEWLLSAANPTERYAQTGFGLECERIGAGTWWSVGPEVGWRQYERETDTIIDAPGFHSSFAYCGLQALVEVSLGGVWRARVIADGRVEKHRDASQDARSLYFSLDVRRLLAPS